MDLIEKLKEAPKGTKLYSTIYGEVTLERVGGYDNSYPIVVRAINDNGLNTCVSFTFQGKYRKDFTKTSECALFPSRENRQWSKFCPYKDGDILACCTDGEPFVFKRLDESGYPIAYFGIDTEGEVYPLKIDPNDDQKWTTDLVRRASQEEAAHLFCELKKAGYRWDSRAKALVKIRPDLPEGTPVMVTSRRDRCIWELRYYYRSSEVFIDGKKSGPTHTWGCIVPVSKFNFENMTFCEEDNYGYSIV